MRRRVIPARNERFAAGVSTTPSFTMKTFDVPVSATLPSMSRIRQLSKPRPRASMMARPLLG